MSKKYFFLFLFFFSFLLNTFSQTERFPNSVSWRWTWNNFQFPISNELIGEDYTTGGEINYSRYLNRWMNLSIPLKFGKAELPQNDEGDFIDSETIASLDALVHFNILPSGGVFNPYLLGGLGVMKEFDNDKNTNAEFPIGLGFNIRLSKGIYASAEAQYRFDTNDNRDQLMHSLGVKFDFGGKGEEEEVADRDNDGVADRDDKCPDEAGIASLRGCPDQDGDGVANHLDDCPLVPGLVDNKGCPSDDRDEDGIKNEKDRCPDVAGSEYADGCPDLDEDGIADIDDMCPSQSGLPENKGCPDSDGDSVADPFDKCPNTKGTIDNAGCPELKPKEKEVLEFAMQAVRFETGSDNLLQTSYSVIDQVEEILKNYPNQKLKISGHTDSIGSVEDNQALSEKRAKACYDYLVKKGIPADRMSYVGFGETVPIADNMFEPGREKNRRVEFEIYAN